MPWFGKKKEEPSGFMGDMSETQVETLNAFKKYIVDEHLTNDPRYDDYYLLRFLRARKFNLEKTIKMFKNFLDWRVEHRVDEAMVIYKCPNIPEAKKLYIHCYHGTDRKGQPFYIDYPCSFDVDDLVKVITKDELYSYYVREYEKLIHIKFPACSAKAGVKIEQSFSLLNIEGFSMSKLKEKSREFVKIAINIGQDSYPEIMSNMFIVNAPFLFKGAWAVFKPFIDEKTRKKISILGSGFQKELFTHVDPSNVPSILGGTCTCSEYEGGCLHSNVGPWNEYPGDEFGEAAKQQLLEEEKKEEVPIPVPVPVSVDPVPVPIPVPVVAVDPGHVPPPVPLAVSVNEVGAELGQMQLSAPSADP